MKSALSKMGRDKAQNAQKQIRLLGLVVAMVLLALTVRFFAWQDNRWDAVEVQSGVTEGYKDSARQLLNGDIKAFVSDINHFGHPPGYPILLAAISKVAGESNTAIQVVQIFCDVIAIVLLFMIAWELFPLSVALIAGLLAAVSPQFAYFPLLLLPDSLVAVPILLAIYFLIRARGDPRMMNFVTAGAFIGISCWLRANYLLLPLFLAAIAALLVQRGKRLRATSAVIAGAILLIAPITIKNVIVYRSFVPISLGAGQTFLEGIADYDDTKRFNLPITDLGLMRQEAEWYGKPEYAQLLFGPDGVERDRMRITRGMAVVRSHPVWFAGVIARRGIASTRLDTVPVIAPESPVSHHFGEAARIWTNDEAKYVSGNEDKYGTLMQSELISVRPGFDYVFLHTLKLYEGRVQLKATDASGVVLAAKGVDLVEGLAPEAQPTQIVAVPFVSGPESSVRFALGSFATPNSVILATRRELVELGPSSHQWLRYARIPLGFVQRVFKTAWILPLVVIGLVLLIRDREWLRLAIILTVPTYYLLVQSTLHTERRYVYVIHFFLLIPVSVALWRLASWLCRVRKRQTAG